MSGRVTGRSAPLPAARRLRLPARRPLLHKVMTDTQGNFLFEDLPAGLYKVIAHKAGFVPAIVMLTRATAQAYQSLEFQLAAAPGRASGRAADDFWALRARVPADVLREIETAENASAGRFQLGDAGLTRRRRYRAVDPATDFQTEMQALTGVDQIGPRGAGRCRRPGSASRGSSDRSRSALRAASPS